MDLNQAFYYAKVTLTPTSDLVDAKTLANELEILDASLTDHIGGNSFSLLSNKIDNSYTLTIGERTCSGAPYYVCDVEITSYGCGGNYDYPPEDPEIDGYLENTSVLLADLINTNFWDFEVEEEVFDTYDDLMAEASSLIEEAEEYHGHDPDWEYECRRDEELLADL